MSKFDQLILNEQRCRTWVGQKFSLEFDRNSNFPGISCLLACFGCPDTFRVRIKVEIGGVLSLPLNMSKPLLICRPVNSSQVEMSILIVTVKLKMQLKLTRKKTQTQMLLQLMCRMMLVMKICFAWLPLSLFHQFKFDQNQMMTWDACTHQPAHFP